MIIFTEEAVSFLSDESPMLLDPSAAELGDLWRHMFRAGAIRFFAIAKKRHFYAWNGDELTHGSAPLYIPELRGVSGVGNFDRQPPWIFSGLGPFVGGKIRLLHSDVFESIKRDRMMIEKSLSYDWSFADRFLEGSIDDFLRQQVEKRMPR
jgi:hypothetical protein